MCKVVKKQMLDFYSTYESANKKLLQLLAEFYGINSFVMQRVYWDGRYFFLGYGDNPINQFKMINYLDIYYDLIKTPHSNIINAVKNDNEKIWFFFKEGKTDEAFLPLIKFFKDSGFRESFVIYKKYKDYYEISNFSIFNSSLVTNKFLYENILNIQNFINYFKIYNYDAICKAEKLIKTKFETNQLLKISQMQDTQNFHNKFLTKLIQLSNKRTFSPKEVECIFLIHKGFSCKEIAQRLNISPRTAEHHIESIKLKGGFGFKSEIREIFN